MPGDMTVDQMVTYLYNSITKRGYIPSRDFNSESVKIKSLPVPRNMFPQERWKVVLKRKNTGDYVDVAHTKELHALRRAAKNLDVTITTRPMEMDGKKFYRVFILIGVNEKNVKLAKIRAATNRNQVLRQRRRSTS